MPLPQHFHPMIVHFPIALFITALLFELAGLTVKNDSLQRAAVYVYVTASLSTPVVLRTGIWEAQKLKIHHPILEEHEHYAIWTMWLSLASLPILLFIYKKAKKHFKAAFIIFLLALAVLVGLTGDKGGRMVFEYGVGVDQ